MTTADTNKSAPEVIVVGDKPERANLVELKNGKLSVKQKGMSFEKMSETMQEIVQFREMLEGRIERKEPPLTTVPDEHRPLFAKLAHESDKTVASISKHVQHELLPAQDEDDEEINEAVLASLPLDVVEKAIKSVATRVNYGLDASAIPNAPVSAKLPAGWQIWRWEVKEEFRDWLPKNAKDKAAARIAERQQIREDVLALFQSLPEPDKASVLGGSSKTSNRTAKSSAKSALSVKSVTKNPPDGTQEAMPIKKADASEDIDNEDQTQVPGTPKTQKSRPKKPVDPEKAARERERLEKKLAKEEKEKKAKEAANKSRHLMANFFGKSKASPAGPSKSTETSKSGVRVKEVSRDGGPSDFDKAFKGFLVKKDAVVAPINWFREVHRGRARVDKGKARDVIVIDDDEPKVVEDFRMDVDDDISITNDPNLGQLTPEERLKNSLDLLHPKLRPPLFPRPPRCHHTFKSYHPQVVRGIMQQLSEAEVAGDDILVRSLLATLRDRSKIPAKVLVFHEDSRPGYFGTWTRNSREVGPRSPFARDVVSLDYTVDSEAEWEEEEEGDVLDGGEEDGEDDGAVAEEVDSDLDSWLVDDDEIVDPGTPIDEREGSPEFPFNVPPPPPPKRKSKEDSEGVNKEAKKRKVVVPLVPFTKGPCWENTIGEAIYEPFKAYSIQLLSDTPFPINPFKFVSTPHIEKAFHPANASGPSKTLASSNAGFVVPALPAYVAASTSSSTSVAGSSTTQSGTANATPPRRGVGPPKTSFPEAHMPLLLAKIKELDTGNLTFIVETVYKELSTQKAGVKKNAIEVKVREVGEKSKDSGSAKVWVVKRDVRLQYGIA